MPTTPLPAVTFTGPESRQDVTAETAAHVAEYGGRFYMRVLHPSGGYVEISSHAVQMFAEDRARTLNDLIGSWARLSA